MSLGSLIVAAISYHRARAIYDRLGARQDEQAFYELPAEKDLVAQAGFEQALSVLEFGCGTGRLAAHLLEHYLPEKAHYLGLDVSKNMVGLSRCRLMPWRDRAEVMGTDGSVQLPQPGGVWDRFLSCYVVDLLSERDITQLLNEAHRLLQPEGRLCLISLTWGKTPLSGLVSTLWACLHRLSCERMGGCRPLHLERFLKPDRWGIDYRNVVARWGISSEVIIARPLASHADRP